MSDAIFYPNELTTDDIADLSGWKLKVAAVHFGVTRGDCVTLGYGYQLRKSLLGDETEIVLVADRDKIYQQAISLADELDWNDPSVLLREIGVDVNDVLRDYLTEHVN